VDPSVNQDPGAVVSVRSPDKHNIHEQDPLVSQVGKYFVRAFFIALGRAGRFVHRYLMIHLGLAVCVVYRDVANMPDADRSRRASGVPER
jgi:hypothetical protein